MIKNYAYDKAKYHYETVEEYGLPLEQAYNHTTFFMAWLIKNGLTSAWFEKEAGEQLEQYKKGAITINKLYEYWDCCLVSDMLSEQGNAFARPYFDFESGKYWDDYKVHLHGTLVSEFHVLYTPANEAIIHGVISQRFAEWQAKAH